MLPTPHTSSYSSSWTWQQDKQFESAILDFPEQTPNRWQHVAAQVPGKTPAQVEKHYEILLQDLMAIESEAFVLPDYPDEEGGSVEPSQTDLVSSKPKHVESERKRGTPWTEEEHKLFLMGLQKYGKGDWRSISRNAVVSRTPTQVASHAQKYFNRLQSDRKEKKRSSIHDIVLPEDGSVVPPEPLAQVQFSPNNQSTVAPTYNPFQQLSFPNQGGSLGYGNFGFPM